MNVVFVESMKTCRTCAFFDECQPVNLVPCGDWMEQPKCNWAVMVGLGIAMWLGGTALFWCIGKVIPWIGKLFGAL